MFHDVEKAYAPVCWKLPDDFDSFERYELALNRLDMKSSPGYPYMRNYATNKELLGFDGFGFDRTKVLLLWVEVQKVLNCDFDTILRLFLKEEPTKRHKIQEGRLRLISCFPTPVQIVWHMCFDYMNDLEIQHVKHIPSKQGMKFVNGEWKFYYDFWRLQGYDVGYDKEAWDWTCHSWIFIADLQFRYRMGRGKRMTEWFQLASWLYRQAYFDCKIVLSNGKVYRQVIPGLQKSGSVNTISTNSHGQIFCYRLAQMRAGLPLGVWPDVAGDDSLEVKSQTAPIDVYKSLGVIIKSASEGLEFLGHDLRPNGPEPLYFFKHVVKALFVEDKDLEQYLDAMACMYVHSYKYWFWEELAELLGLSTKLRSRHYYLTFYDTPEQ